MSVSVPGSVSGNLKSEYAATNISINRQMIKNENGFLVSAFTANIPYEKKTYVVDADNNKIGMVVSQDAPMMIPMDDTSRGNIFLDIATFAQYFSKTTSQGEILGELVANLIDQLIHEDLIKRGILTA